MKELIELYIRNKKQLLLNLTNVLKSTTNVCQKKGKKNKSIQIFLIL